MHAYLTLAFFLLPSLDLPFLFLCSEDEGEKKKKEPRAAAQGNAKTMYVCNVNVSFHQSQMNQDVCFDSLLLA